MGGCPICGSLIQNDRQHPECKECGIILCGDCYCSCASCDEAICENCGTKRLKCGCIYPDSICYGCKNNKNYTCVNCFKDICENCPENDTFCKNHMVTNTLDFYNTYDVLCEPWMFPDSRIKEDDICIEYRNVRDLDDMRKSSCKYIEKAEKLIIKDSKIKDLTQIEKILGMATNMKSLILLNNNLPSEIFKNS